MKKFYKLILSFLFVSIIASNFVFGAENNNPLPYNEEEFPQALKDLRRFEIITLGSMPFVMLDTNIAYSFIRYYKNGKSQDYKPNPFGAKNYEQKEQVGLILTSLSISAGIGITDLVVQKVKQSSKLKKTKREQTVIINPISEDPDAIKIDINKSQKDFTEGSEDLDEVEVLE